MKTPYEYYQEGNWNWDTMLELARKLTSDEDGDDNPDIWGFAAHPMHFYQTTGVDLVTIENGAVTNNLRSATLARAMKFLYDAGPQKYNVRTTDLSKWETLFPRGRLAMLLQEDYVKETYIELIREGKVGIAPAPKDPEADEYYIPGKIEASWIPNGAQNVAGAVAYMTVVMMNDQDPELIAWSREQTKQLYNFPMNRFKCLETWIKICHCSIPSIWEWGILVIKGNGRCGVNCILGICHGKRRWRNFILSSKLRLMR